MFSKISGTDGFLELISDSSFWFTLAIIIGAIVLLVMCLKYPKIGGPVILSLFCVVLIGLDVFCVLQINNYYTAEGGIHGKLTGIFNTNEVKVVDTLKFEVSNIELKKTSDGYYSANILTDKVLSLDTRESLGVFVNGMPCDTTSEVNSDYAIANYVYTFYDKDKTAMCTDTLILNFAFYGNSTYLSLSTKGGTLPVEECVEYWHYYFNKNGFIVEIAPFEKVSSNITNTSGDISNYSLIRYYVGDELWKAYYALTGSTISLIEYDSDNLSAWTTNERGKLYTEYLVCDDIDFYAVFVTECIESGITMEFTCDELDYGVSVDLNDYIDKDVSLVNLDGCDYYCLKFIFSSNVLDNDSVEVTFESGSELHSYYAEFEACIDGKDLIFTLDSDNVLHLNLSEDLNTRVARFILNISSLEIVFK